MSKLKFNKEKAKNLLKPFWKIENKELDQISKTILIDPTQDNLEFRVTDSIIYLKAELEEYESGLDNPVSFDLHTLRQVIDYSDEEVVIYREGEEYYSDVLSGSLFIRSYHFDKSLYDPLDGVSSLTWTDYKFDRKKILNNVESFSKLGTSSNGPEFSFIFYNDDEAFVCNDFSISREENDFNDYSLPLAFSSYFVNIMKNGIGDDEEFVVHKSGEAYVVSCNNISLYYDPQGDTLASDYKDAVTEPEFSFTVERKKVQNILSMIGSIPMMDDSILFDFGEELFCSVYTKKGEESTFYLSEEKNGDAEEQSIEISLSNFQRVVGIFDSDEIEIGVSEYSISVSGGNRTSIIFLT